MPKVKLLICYHKPAMLLKDDILTPIHAGRERATLDDSSFKWMMDNMIGDDTGENISGKNRHYNEMTSLYWAWKNYGQLGDPDYIGLMHYRRHFVFRENEYKVYNISDFDEDTYLEEINYSKENVESIVENCDFLPHIGKVINVYNHYIENHRKEDLDLAVEILLEKYPKYKTVVKDYFAGDYSNFCNMFIFKKSIFFEYCEWIFDILGEFENRVDISEKRFFISERLTGIFIAKLMRDKSLKYKVLPIAFIDDPIKIPIAMPINSDNMFQAANTITSILEAAKGHNQFQFYLLHNESLDDIDKDKFNVFQKNYSNCKVILVELCIGEEYYPLYISQLLGRENKCIYLSGDIIVLHDLGEFYRVCSTDDYYAVGSPLHEYNNETKEKKVSHRILVLNCARLRKYKIWENVEDKVEREESGVDIFNESCKNQLGYVPWYYFTKESEVKYKDSLFGNPQPRDEVQQQTTWRAFMIYDDKKPWINNQGVYSIFWWDNAIKVPVIFKFVSVNTEELNFLYGEQQKVINLAKERVPGEVWRNDSLTQIVKNYYHENGLKRTVIHSCKKAIKILIGKESKSHG